MGLRAMRAEAPHRNHGPGQSPEEVARRTSELLGERGWCLWQCDVLGGDVIAVVDEAARGVPEGLAVYTVPELYLLLKLDETTIRLIHEAKKLGGAVVVGVIEPHDGEEAMG